MDEWKEKKRDEGTKGRLVKTMFRPAFFFAVLFYSAVLFCSAILQLVLRCWLFFLSLGL